MNESITPHLSILLNPRPWTRPKRKRKESRERDRPLFPFLLRVSSVTILQTPTLPCYSGLTGHTDTPAQPHPTCPPLRLATLYSPPQSTRSFPRQLPRPLLPLPGRLTWLPCLAPLRSLPSFHHPRIVVMDTLPATVKASGCRARTGSSIGPRRAHRLRLLHLPFRLNSHVSSPYRPSNTSHHHPIQPLPLSIHRSLPSRSSPTLPLLLRTNTSRLIPTLLLARRAKLLLLLLFPGLQPLPLPPKSSTRTSLARLLSSCRTSCLPALDGLRPPARLARASTMKSGRAVARKKDLAGMMSKHGGKTRLGRTASKWPGERGWESS
jgi:hypothetical protein